MAIGPTQTSALVCLLGGAALHSGLQSIRNFFFPAVIAAAATPTTAAPSLDSEVAAPNAAIGSGWTVGLATAFQFGLLCLSFGVGLGIYLVVRFWHTPVGSVQLAVANNTAIDLGQPLTRSHESRATTQRSRRGRRGVLEKSAARPTGVGLV